MSDGHESIGRRICATAHPPQAIRNLRAAAVAHGAAALPDEYIPVEVSAFFRDAFAKICRRLKVRPPRLYFVESADGHIAFYLKGRGIVVVGTTEFAERATLLWRSADPTLRAAIAADYQSRFRAPLNEARCRIYFAHLVLVLVLAHELGHALHDQGRKPYFSDEEADADFVAGWVARRFNLPQDLGEFVFSDFGCQLEKCDHPPPAQRRSAFDLGFEDAAAGAQTPSELSPPHQTAASSQSTSDDASGFLLAAGAALGVVLVVSELKKRRRF